MTINGLLLRIHRLRGLIHHALINILVRDSGGRCDCRCCRSSFPPWLHHTPNNAYHADQNDSNGHDDDNHQKPSGQSGPRTHDCGHSCGWDGTAVVLVESISAQAASAVSVCRIACIAVWIDAAGLRINRNCHKSKDDRRVCEVLHD